MLKNSVEATCEIIYQSELARRLKVTPGAIKKAKDQKYFPSDWFERIVIATNNEITFERLYDDLYTYKYGIVPQVLREDAYLLKEQLKKGLISKTKSPLKKGASK